MSSKTVRYESNPFVEDMQIEVRNKAVRLSRLGKDDNVVINQTTGEYHGGTHVTTYKKVDSAQFVKVFTANIALTFGLASAGIKTFSVLLWAVQHKALAKDEIDLDSMMLEDFLEAHKENEPAIRLSHPTFKRGLVELEKAKIIAKAMRKGRYYINPNFLFNGDRVAFSTVLERA